MSSTTLPIIPGPTAAPMQSKLATLDLYSRASESKRREPALALHSGRGVSQSVSQSVSHASCTNDGERRESVGFHFSTASCMGRAMDTCNTIFNDNFKFLHLLGTIPRAPKPLLTLNVISHEGVVGQRDACSLNRASQRRRAHELQ